MTASAKVQGKDAWWNEVQQDVAKLDAVHKAWAYRCQPKPGSAKFQPLGIGVYLEECRQEEQILKDGLYEMFNLKHYQHFMAKPKNGCMDAEVAKQKWLAYFTAPGSIADKLGPTKELMDRVAIKKGDFLTLRSARIKSNVVPAKGHREKDCDEGIHRQVRSEDEQVDLQVGHECVEGCNGCRTLSQFRRSCCSRIRAWGNCIWRLRTCLSLCSRRHRSLV